jgi:preprotein translocase subunit SecA
MRNINGEVLSNLFKSTQQLAAFEQFLAQLAMMQQAPANNVPPLKSTEEPEKPKPHNPGSDGPKLILPSAMVQKKPMANVGRNDPCPCGSGKKFKACCGRLS